MKTPRILETTLRDGSYAINFQFTAGDTSLICTELEQAGFDLIEIGHGIGLGASKAGKGQAVESDESYMKAAVESLKSASWGMFCIPGIAKVEDVDLAAEYKMGFIRVGTNVEDAEQSAPFIERARKHGMYVTSNFMKSYAMPPREFAKKALLSKSYGSDVLYIVDSAGGMLPDELTDYFNAVRDVCDIRLAFHAHNNLGLAVSNSLKAMDLGAEIIDTSLQGMGRSAGNVPTEIFLVVLERMGLHTGIDILKTMDIGEKFVQPLLVKRGLDSIDVISGYSQFHSSYMSVVREFSSKYRVDPRKLIVKLCEKNKVSAPRALVEEIAKSLAGKAEPVFTARFHLERFYGAEQNLSEEGEVS
jgi:4-hydroxy-2-oxovalerate aldolase